MPEGAVRFTLSDVEAAIENLRTDERIWHGSMSRQQRAENLNSVFNVESRVSRA